MRYRFLDPIAAMRGGKSAKSENRTGPQNRDLKSQGARLDGARVISEAPSQASSVQLEPPEIAPQREHGSGAGAKMSSEERAALIARLDSNPTKADWELWSRDLDARLTSAT